MNKIIKLLSIIVLSVISQIGIASAPAQQPLTKVNPLMLDLKDILEKHYNEHSSSLKMDREIEFREVREQDKYIKTIFKLTKIVDDLASHNDINTLTDRDGNTLLILAARYNCYTLAKYLIIDVKFTNLNAKNKYNFTAYDYVRLPSSQSPKFDEAKDFFKVENGQLVKLKYKPVIVPNERFAKLLKETSEIIENEQNKSVDELGELTQFAEIELQRKREVVAAAIAQKNKDAKAESEWLALDQQRKEDVEQRSVLHAFTMRAVHEDSYWHGRYRGDVNALALKNEHLQAKGVGKDAVQWWQEHSQENCAVCKKYKQAQLAAAANPKQLQRRKSF